MRKMFNTDIDDFEIIDLIIDNIGEDSLQMLVEENVLLKHKCKVGNCKKFKFNEKVVLEQTKILYRKDLKLRKSIMKLWNIRVKHENKKINSIKEINELKELIGNIKIFDCMFNYCTILWQKDDEEFNRYADELFEVYNEKKQSEEEDGKIEQVSFNFTEGEVNVDEKIISLSLGECIQTIASSKKEIEEKSLQLKKQEEEIKELKNSLGMVIDNRDLKKEIKSLTRKINEVQSNIKEENEKLKLDLLELKKENLELKKIISSIEKKINAYDSNMIVKQVTESQTNISNILKGGIVENLTKNIEGLFLNFEQKLKDINETPKVIKKEPKKEMKELLAGEKGNVDILLEDINILK